MKLELKHLAPYLPYSLDFIFSKSGRIITMQSCLNNGALIIIDSNEGNNYDLAIWNFKPILRPLSDLKTDGEMNDLLFAECGRIDENLDYVCEYEKDLTCTSLSFRAVMILIKEKFDVFGLIPQGLAIDMNTLKEKV